MEARIRAIEERNARVEADKAWETSTFRVVTLALITYIVAALVLFFIGVPDFYLAALVPVVGFILSTRSLSFLKHWWIARYIERDK